jgi:hypothetical protein
MKLIFTIFRAYRLYKKMQHHVTGAPNWLEVVAHICIPYKRTADGKDANEAIRKEAINLAVCYGEQVEEKAIDHFYKLRKV